MPEDTPTDWVALSRATGIETTETGAFVRVAPIDWDATAGIPDDVANPTHDEPSGLRVPWGRGR